MNLGPTIKRPIGDVIREERERLGWTSSELARRSGVRAATIRSIETRYGGMWNTIVAISRGLGIETEVLIAKTRDIQSPHIPPRPVDSVRANT